ncbi:MAG: hypothetical protein WKF54_00635 [Nocardioidaceae bacterium]
MPDPRLEDIARRAESASHAAEFAELARRGRRRRAIASGAGGAAAVLAVGVMFVGVRGVYADQSAPIPPTQPSPSVTTTTPTAPTRPTHTDPSKSPTSFYNPNDKYAADLIALMKRIGVRNPGADHGQGGATVAGPYHDRLLQVSSSLDRFRLPGVRNLGSVTLNGVSGSVIGTDIWGEVVVFEFGRWTYVVISFSTTPQSWRSHDPRSSDRAHALHAARALVHALQTK